MKRIAALLLVFALAASACGDGSSPRAGGPALYLSLGDSIAAGNGASDPAETSFPALLAESQEVELVNLAVAGATTQHVIDHQLPEAARRLTGDDIAFITLSAGGNDLAALIPNATCQQDPLPESCPLDSALSGVEENLVTIMDGLREAYPATPIVILAYPNFFSGTGHDFEGPAGRVLPRLANTVERVVAGYEAAAVAHASFAGRGGELTHVNDAQFDPHPNDAGHEVIARAFEDALAGVE